MPNAHGRSIDATHLAAEREVVEGAMHRDFLAHMLRWQHVVRYLKKGHDFANMRVLDVGCGKEAPLPKMLLVNRLHHGPTGTGQYVGVDYNPVITPHHWVTSAVERKVFNGTFVPGTDFAHQEKAAYAGRFDLITCFEMLEHVEPAHTFATLTKIRDKLATSGEALLSTPCFDHRVGAATNHVNEMSYHAFKFALAVAGLEVMDVFGTFAYKRDYKEVLRDAGISPMAYERLSEYYFPELLACLMAPLFPERSRNCLWRVSRRAPLKVCPSPPPFGPTHSNAAGWDADLRKFIEHLT